VRDARNCRLPTLEGFKFGAVALSLNAKAHFSLLTTKASPDTHIKFPVQLCPYSHEYWPKLLEKLIMEGSVGRIEVRNSTFSLYFSLLTGIHAETGSQQDCIHRHSVCSSESCSLIPCEFAAFPDSHVRG
jgi:hypothetical protein